MRNAVANALFQAAVGSTAFRLPGIVPGRRHQAMAQRSMGDRLRDYCIADVWIATARQKTDGASVAPSGLHLKNTPPFLGLRGPPGRLPQAVLPRPLRGLCRCAAAVSQAIHGTAAVRCQSMTDTLSSRNRSPIDHDGQRADCGYRRLISGCRRSSSLICRASCQDDDTLPWRNSQWVTDYAYW